MISQAEDIEHPNSVGMALRAGAPTEARTKIGIDANRPIDPRTGKIESQMLDPWVISSTGTGWVRLNFVLGPWASPDDLARSVTRMTGELIRHKGGTPDVLKGWDYSPEQMLALSDAFDVFVGGDIQQLRCDAEKRLMHTRMVIELEMVVYVGKVREGIVHRRPVRMRSERVAATFGPRELERFLNDMVSEALETGCRDIP